MNQQCGGHSVTLRQAQATDLSGVPKGGGGRRFCTPEEAAGWRKVLR